MSTPTEPEARAAYGIVELCNELEKHEAWRKIVLPHIAEREQHHLDLGTKTTLPAEKRAEHHEAYHDAVALKNLLDTQRAEARRIIEAYRLENGATPL